MVTSLLKDASDIRYRLLNSFLARSIRKSFSQSSRPCLNFFFLVWRTFSSSEDVSSTAAAMMVFMTPFPRPVLRSERSSMIGCDARSFRAMGENSRPRIERSRGTSGDVVWIETFRTISKSELAVGIKNEMNKERIDGGMSTRITGARGQKSPKSRKSTRKRETRRFSKSLRLAQESPGNPPRVRPWATMSNLGNRRL